MNISIQNTFTINASKCIQTLRQKREAYNSTRDTITVLRKVKDLQGKEQTVTVERKAGVFRQQYLDTAQKLASMFAANHNKQLKGRTNVTELVPVKTSNPDLASKLGICERTVRNHLKWLQNFGFLHKNFRGSKAAFDLFIHPDYLVNNFNVSLTQIPEFYPSFSTPKSPFSTEERKNLPHTPIKEHQGTDIEIKDAEKQNNLLIKASKGQQSDMDTVVNMALEGQKETLKALSPVSTTNKKIGGAEGPQNVDKLVDKSETVDHFSNLPIVYKEYVILLWNYAHSRLYGNKPYTRNELVKIKSAIAKGVFGNFKYKWTELEWDKYLRYCYRAIDYAQNYLEKHENKYAGIPYAVEKPGTGYFDYENMNGFRGAMGWIQKSIDQRKEEESYRKLRLAVKHVGYAKHSDSRLPGKFMTMNFTQLSNYYSAYLEKNFGKQVQNQYLELIAKGQYNYVPKTRAKRI